MNAGREVSEYWPKCRASGSGIVSSEVAVFGGETEGGHGGRFEMRRGGRGSPFIYGAPLLDALAKGCRTDNIQQWWMGLSQV